LPSLAEALAQGRPQRLLTLATAGWLRYLRGVDEQGNEIILQDDRADELRRLANEGMSDPRPLLNVRRVFGSLGDNQAWVAKLSEALGQLDARGAKAILLDL
jgi:fructuronate reductase/mannitol 2-dehydrogenase